MCSEALYYPHPLTMCKHYSKIGAFPPQSKMEHSTQGTLRKCQSHQVKLYRRTLSQELRSHHIFLELWMLKPFSLSIVFKAQNKCYLLKEAFFTIIFNDPTLFRSLLALIISTTSHFNCLLFLLELLWNSFLSPKIRLDTLLVQILYNT